MRTALFLFFLLIFHCTAAHAALRTNEQAPPFALGDRDLRMHRLEDILASRGSGTQGGAVISFFASWCLECRNELPVLNSLVRELSQQGIVVVLIGVREDFAKITPLLAELKVDGPIVLSDPDGRTSERYQVRFLPMTFCIGRDGRIRDMIFGGISGPSEVRSCIEPLRR